MDSLHGFYMDSLSSRITDFIISHWQQGNKGIDVYKGIGGILQIYFYFNFRIAYCGVHLFLNEFLKSAEKLIAEKYNYKNWITNQLYTPFDNHHIQEKDILPQLQVKCLCSNIHYAIPNSFKSMPFHICPNQTLYISCFIWH